MIKKEWWWMNQLNQNKMNDNKLIAEFMGSNLNGLESWQYEEELQYHTSWDWLMPVVEKIYQLDSNADFFGSINLEATYKEVVEFIKQLTNE